MYAYVLDDLTVHYSGDFTGDPATGTLGLEILPTTLADAAAGPRDRIDEAAARHHPDTGPARTVEPLAAAARPGDAVHEPFAGGRTLRRSETAARLRVRLHEPSAASSITTTDAAPITTIPAGAWTASATLTPSGTPLTIAGPRLRWHHPAPWSGAVALLSRAG